MLFSQIRAKIQGHRCILDGPNPGLIIGNTGDFIPFVTEEGTQFCLLPMYPPPSSAARHAGFYSTSMRVLNLNKSGESSMKAQVLIANPLVTRILIKRSKIKRATAADRKQRNLLRIEGRRIQKEKERLLEEKRRLGEEKRLVRSQANKADYATYHRKCGHANLRYLVTFKRQGKVIASRLPSKFLRNYRKECPLCLAVKKEKKIAAKRTNIFP